MRGHLVDCGDCPYLPGQRFHAFHPESWHADEYRTLMDAGFRRSGIHLYRPLCPDCRACRPIRVDIPAFRPRDDQRRCDRRNADLLVSVAPRGCDAERRALFDRYQAAVHDGAPSEAPDAFLVADGGVPGYELQARDGDGRLLAVSVLDAFADALSSVYCYWDPMEAKRALGTFMALAEIRHGAATGRRWLYLGFLVADCRKMAYKARFLPCEVLGEEGWERRT